MKRQISILTILIFTTTLSSFGQTSKILENKDEMKALAKLISLDYCDKICIARYLIIKDFTDTSFTNDTIRIGYYNYKEPIEKLDTVLLTLNKYKGETEDKDYYTCPEYDGKLGIQKAKIDFVSYNYWEGCETGKGECKPLNFTRNKNEKNWFLIMPCGGTQTDITISGTDNNYSKELHLNYNNCPPYIELTNLNDGNYSANMRACGLGGTINFKLKTN